LMTSCYGQTMSPWSSWLRKYFDNIWNSLAEPEE
jgi:hypothetical protein